MWNVYSSSGAHGARASGGRSLGGTHVVLHSCLHAENIDERTPYMLLHCTGVPRIRCPCTTYSEAARRIDAQHARKLCTWCSTLQAKVQRCNMQRPAEIYLLAVRENHTELSSSGFPQIAGEPQRSAWLMRRNSITHSLDMHCLLAIV